MHSSSTKGQYSSVDLQQHKAEISYQKLGMLLALIAFIWVLCYNAESQFSARHIMDTYDRIGENKVTQQSFKYAKQLATQVQGSKAAEKQRADIFKKYQLVNDVQQNICVILIHKQGQESWLKSVKSIIGQDYSSYRVYYLNNYQSGREIYKHMDDNALDKNKFKVIQNIPDSDYVKEFTSAKNYCDKDNIVVYMSDSERLVGNNVFLVINAFFKQNPNLKLLYSSYIIGEDKGSNTDFQVGRAVNAYPEEIIKENKYAYFPFIMTGLKAFRAKLFNQVTQQQITNSKSQPFEHADQAAVGIGFLTAAKENILYVPEPLIWKQSQCNCITVDDKVKKQFKEISAKYSNV